MRKSSIVKGMAAAAAVLTFGTACSRDPQPTGQLMLALQTDMALPKDVDQVTIQILSQGIVRFNHVYRADPSADDRILIPATLGIVAGDNPNAPVTVRIIARQNGKARVLREAISTIPTRRSATLRVPIQWLCDGSAVEDPNDRLNDDKVSSSCPAGQTCRAGVCVPVTVYTDQLLDYEDGTVFGGGGGDTAGSCIDTLGCFQNGFGSQVEFSTCSVEKPSGGAGVNVALVKPLGTDGICGQDSCLVPLDGESDAGWRTIANRIVLPRPVCDRILDGTVLGVAVTTSCSTKSEATPTCGPWSSVQGDYSDAKTPGPNVDANNGGLPASPPPPTPGAPAGDGSNDLVLAIRKLTFNDGKTGSDGKPLPDGWQKYGYNLDHKVTLPSVDPDAKWNPNGSDATPDLMTKDVCQSVDHALPGYAFEGYNGIDNAFGFVVQVLNSLQEDWIAQLNQAIASGQQTLLVRVGDVGSQTNYLGLQGALFTGAPFECPGADGGAPDGGGCTPAFSGTDVWPIGGESVIGGNATLPRVTFPGAYMTGRYWVSGTQASDLGITFNLKGQPLTLQIHRAVITAKIEQDGTVHEGTLAGILDTEEFLSAVKRVIVGYSGNTSYCGPAEFDTLAGTQLRQFSDILVDGTQDPNELCNGISFGVGFEAVPAKLGVVKPSASPPPDPCAQP